MCSFPRDPHCTGWEELWRVQRRVVGSSKPPWVREDAVMIKHLKVCLRSCEYFASVSLWMMMLNKGAEAEWRRSGNDHSQSWDFLLSLRIWIIAISERLKNVLICEITGLVITLSNKSVKSGRCSGWLEINKHNTCTNGEWERVCV